MKFSQTISWPHSNLTFSSKTLPYKFHSISLVSNNSSHTLKEVAAYTQFFFSELAYLPYNVVAYFVEFKQPKQTRELLQSSQGTAQHTLSNFF